MTVQVKIKLGDEVLSPVYASNGAACFDFFANIKQDVSIAPGGTAVIPTGVSVAIPQDYGMFIYSRSGHGFKHGVRLANCVGVIDSDYRGEIMVKLVNDGAATMTVTPKSRIAQGCLVAVPTVQFVPVYSLDYTDRGSDGFGSTGG